MIPEPLKVKNQLKSGAPIVGLELDQIENQISILDEESEKVQGRFIFHVTERLGATNNRQSRQEAATDQLHKTVNGTGVQ